MVKYAEDWAMHRDIGADEKVRCMRVKPWHPAVYNMQCPRWRNQGKSASRVVWCSCHWGRSRTPESHLSGVKMVSYCLHRKHRLHSALVWLVWALLNIVASSATWCWSAGGGTAGAVLGWKKRETGRRQARGQNSWCLGVCFACRKRWRHSGTRCDIVMSGWWAFLVACWLENESEYT